MNIPPFDQQLFDCLPPRVSARFSADASHELKTPLTMLRTSIEALLRSDTLSEQDGETVAGLLEETKRISSITSGLLLLARADAGKLVIERRTVDLRAVIVACGDDARIVAVIALAAVIGVFIYVLRHLKKIERMIVADDLIPAQRGPRYNMVLIICAVPIVVITLLLFLIIKA